MHDTHFAISYFASCGWEFYTENELLADFHYTSEEPTSGRLQMLAVSESYSAGSANVSLLV